MKSKNKWEKEHETFGKRRKKKHYVHYAWDEITRAPTKKNVVRSYWVLLIIIHNLNIGELLFLLNSFWFGFLLKKNSFFSLFILIIYIFWKNGVFEYFREIKFEKFTTKKREKATHTHKICLNNHVDPILTIISFDYNNPNKYKYSNKIKVIYIYIDTNRILQ